LGRREEKIQSRFNNQPVLIPASVFSLSVLQPSTSKKTVTLYPSSSTRHAVNGLAARKLLPPKSPLGPNHRQLDNKSFLATT